MLILNKKKGENLLNYIFKLKSLIKLAPIKLLICKQDFCVDKRSERTFESVSELVESKLLTLGRTKLATAHEFNERVQRSLVLVGILFLPHGEPKSTTRQILEYKISRVHSHRLFRHATVRDHGCVLVQQAHHVRGCFATDTIQCESRLWYALP